MNKRTNELNITDHLIQLRARPAVCSAVYGSVCTKDRLHEFARKQLSD